MATIVRILAITATAFVALGFMTFAADRSEEGSDNQVQSIDGRAQPMSDSDIDRPAPPPVVERRREARHSDFREVIDDANDYLLKPFAVVDSDNLWVERMVPAALGLLGYGLLGLLLANFIPRHRAEHHSWNEATS